MAFNCLGEFTGHRKLVLSVRVCALQQEEAGDNLGGPSPKKQRHVWTSEAHHKFSNIVKVLGDSRQVHQPHNISTAN